MLSRSAEGKEGLGICKYSCKSGCFTNNCKGGGVKGSVDRRISQKFRSRIADLNTDNVGGCVVFLFFKTITLE